MKDEIVSLTSVRGLAAFWVVLFHFAPILIDVMPESKIIFPIILSGEFAVPLFFVLSGYVIGLRYLTQMKSPTKKMLLRFWWLRLCRIYPTHICMLVTVLALLVHKQWPYSGLEGLDFKSFMANIFLIHAWDPNSGLSWNYPSWTISSEWFAYLMFPVLAILFRKIKRWQMITTIVIMGGVSAFIYSFSSYLPFQHLVSVVPTFMGGVAISAICFPSNMSGLWADISLLSMIILPFILKPGMLQSALFLLLIFSLISALGVAGHQSSWFWKWPPLQYLGKISYSLYMSHAILIALLKKYLPIVTWSAIPFGLRIVFMVSCLILMVGLAIVLHYAVEQPWRNWSRQKANVWL